MGVVSHADLVQVHHIFPRYLYEQQIIFTTNANDPTFGINPLRMCDLPRPAEAQLGMVT
jgi:hypothetical protein